MNSANEKLRTIRKTKATITKKYQRTRLRLEDKYAHDMSVLDKEEEDLLQQFNDIPVKEIYKNTSKVYRKKPLLVEAYQTDHEQEIITLNGPVTAHVGDYILKDAKGREYPCDREVFEETYEEVE